MKNHPPLFHRRSIRLENYDYSQAGAYYLTLCSHHFQHLFGTINQGEMQLSRLGLIVQNEWLKTAIMRPAIRLGAFMIMPNHLHGILEIIENDNNGFTFEEGKTDLLGFTERVSLRTEQYGKPVSGSIPTIIRSFKATVTKQINILRGTPGVPVWQRNYWERVIRNGEEYQKFSAYIQNNPAKWELDRFRFENP